MAYISKITLPNGSTYDIKDAEARIAIEAFAGGNAVVFMGVSSTALTDGGNENPTVNNTAVTTKTAGQLYFYGTQEYVYGKDNKWHELGSLESLGALAYKDIVKYDKATSATYTNTNSSKSLTLSGTSSNVAITSTPNTSGNYQPEGTISQLDFTGTQGTVSSTGTVTSGTVTLATENKTATVAPASSGTATYTPSGTITQPASGGQDVSFTGTFTPEGSVGLTTTSTTPTITGNVSTSSTGNTFQIKGSNTAPTISVATAGSTDTIQPASSVTVAKTVVAAAPGATAPANSLTYYNVNEANETLSLYQLGYTTGASISLGTAKTFKTGDAAYQATAPTFTGQYVKLTNSSFNLPTGASFTGTEGNVSTSGKVGFSGTGVRLVTGNIAVPTSAALANTAITASGTFTPEGTVSQPTFTGKKVQLAGTTTASGSVTLPTISLGYTETQASVTVS